MNSHHFSTNDLHNIQTLNLQFSKANNKASKAKPLSDRVHGQIYAKSATPKTDRIVLLQKKKNYSNTIRQKNMNSIKSRNKKNVVIDLRHDSELKHNKENYQKNEKKSQLSARTKLENSSKKKSIFYGRNHSLSDLRLQTIEEKQQFPNESMHDFFPNDRDEEMSSAVYCLHQSKMKLAFCPQIVNEFVQENKRTIENQKNTLKEEIVCFKKQKPFINGDQQVTKMSKQLPERENKENEHNFFDNKDQIMESMRAQIHKLTLEKSNLALKVHVVEKRLKQEVDGVKKKMAKELATWKEKWAKVKAENLKIKSKRNQFFEMEISSDE